MIIGYFILQQWILHVDLVH